MTQEREPHTSPPVDPVVEADDGSDTDAGEVRPQDEPDQPLDRAQEGAGDQEPPPVPPAPFPHPPGT